MGVVENKTDDEKTETINPSEADKAEDQKTVDSVSEQLEKLNVATISDETQPSETQSGGDTVVTSTSS